MPESAFNAITDKLKKAGQACLYEPPPADKQDIHRQNDPTEEGRRIASESSAAFRQAIKIKN